MRRWVLAAVLVVALAGNSYAADVLQEEAGILGADKLREGLTEESAALLEDVSPVEGGDFAGNLQKIFRAVVEQAGGWVRAGLRTCAGMLAVGLICAAAGTMGGERLETAARMAGCLAIAALCTAELDGMAGLAKRTLEELSDFSALLLPVLSSALAASGGVTSGGALYAGATLLVSVLTNLIRSFLIPCVYGYLFLATAEHAIGDGRLTRLRELAGWVVKTVLRAAVAAFTVYLTLTGMLAGATDELTLKAAKGVVSAAIPVVGSMISEASQAILTSAGVIRQASGAFGMLAVLATALGPFCRIGAQYLALRATAALGGFVAQKEQTGLLACAAEAMGDLLAMTGSAAVMVLVAVCAFLKAVNG